MICNVAPAEFHDTLCRYPSLFDQGPKANGKLRPCGDYRRLNEMTIDDKYTLPHIQDFNRHLEGATIFSKIDLQRGYHQVPVHPDHIPETAICTPFGLFEY